MDGGPPTPNLLQAALLALADRGVDFVVCGGVACVLHGVARTTHDLDVSVALDDSNLRGVVDAARVLGLVPRIPEPVEALLDPERRRAWIEEKNALVYTLLAPSGTFALDVFLSYPVDFPGLRSRADRYEIAGREILVSSKADLVAAKRAVRPPRKQDLRDIEDLLELLRG